MRAEALGGMAASDIANKMVADAVGCEPVSGPESLLTGNFTGNFAIIWPYGRYEQQETTVLQPLPERFPTEPIRENSSINRERKTQSREWRPRQCKRPFLAYLICSRLDLQMREEPDEQKGPRIRYGEAFGETR
jgi:hypothetical protein